MQGICTSRADDLCGAAAAWQAAIASAAGAVTGGSSANCAVQSIKSSTAVAAAGRGGLASRSIAPTGTQAVASIY